MSYLYGRLANFETGISGGTGINIESTDADGLDRGIRIAFDVSKTVHSDANTALIQLYNLKKETRLGIKKGDVARLWAGYRKTEESFSLILEGFITRVLPGSRSGGDVITEIECGDGTELFSTQQVEQTFKVGTSVREVILSVARKFTDSYPDPDPNKTVVFGGKAKKPKLKSSPLSVRGLEREKGQSLSTLEASLEVQGFPTKLRNKLSVSGNAREVMDKLSRMWRFDWSVQNGELQVLPYGVGLPAQVLSITPESGLIGVPEVTDFGCRFTALIIPGLTPGAIVSVSSEAVSGQYRIETVHYAGDTRGGAWTVEVEAVGI